MGEPKTLLFRFVCLYLVISIQYGHHYFADIYYYLGVVVGVVKLENAKCSRDDLSNICVTDE